MKKIFILSLSLIGVLLSSFLLPNKEIIASATSNNEKFIIQAYGDSISYGEGLQDINNAYPNVFAKHYIDNLNAEFYANGISGSTTMSLLEKLEPYQNGTASDMDKFNETDLVVLCIGANNVLIPAIDSIPNYMAGSMTAEDLRSILAARVEQFKIDYPQILETFANKKILVMTVYNPYKYTTLKDIKIDDSVGNDKVLVQWFINTYNNKFKEMLDISMEYLQIINNEIIKSANKDVQVVDVWTQFSKFSKTEYLDYINADISKVTITSTDVTSLKQGNISPIMTKIYGNCDPHPTKEGHNVIAQKHLNEYKIFQIEKTKTSNNKSLLTVKSILNENYTFKYFKQVGNNKILLAETNENSYEIDNNKIDDAEQIFAEVYLNNNIVSTTNILKFNQANDETNFNWTAIIISGTLVIIGGVCATVVIIKKQKSKKK